MIRNRFLNTSSLVRNIQGNFLEDKLKWDETPDNPNLEKENVRKFMAMLDTFLDLHDPLDSVLLPRHSVTLSDLRNSTYAANVQVPEGIFNPDNCLYMFYPEYKSYSEQEEK